MKKGNNKFKFVANLFNNNNNNNIVQDWYEVVVEVEGEKQYKSM